MKYKIEINDLDRGYLKGLATITIADSFKVTGVKIGEAEKKGFFIGMPSRSNGVDDKGKAVYKDVCHPISKDFRDELYNNIFRTFDSLHDGKGNKLTFNTDSQDELKPTVRVTPLSDKGTLKGMATVVFNDDFVINDITVKESREGKLFVAFPSYKTNNILSNGMPEYKDICFPVTSEFSKEIKDRILNTYEIESKNIGQAEPQKEQKKVAKKEPKAKAM